LSPSSVTVVIATCPPACFRADDVSGVSLRRAIWLVLFCLTGLIGRADAFVLGLNLGSIEHDDFTLQDLRLSINDSTGAAQLSAGALAVGERHWSNVRLDCPQFSFSGDRLKCARGQLSVPGVHEQLGASLELDTRDMSLRFALRTPEGERVSGDLDPSGGLGATLESVRVESLVDWVPLIDDYGVQGRFSGSLELRPKRTGGTHVALSGRLSEAAFSSDDGLQAAENLLLDVDIAGRYTGEAFDGRVGLDWVEGEAYLHPIYLVAAGGLELDGRIDADSVTVRQASLRWPGLEDARASGRYHFTEGVERAIVEVGRADLSLLGPNLIAPLFTPARTDSLAFSGAMSGSLEFDAEGLAAVDLMLDDVATNLNDGEFGVGSVSGSLPWRRETPQDIRLRVSGGFVQALEFGDFIVDARVHGNQLLIPRIDIPVLDGGLVLTGLGLAREPDGWHGQGSAHIRPVSVSKLTSAIGLPTMSGILSASLPQLRVSPGEVVMDGALVVSVFDGYLHVSNLQILEPFGVAAYLYSDVAVRHLDLAQFTETFDFGSMTGFIDADILGLELSRWRPVRFDANLRSSPGRYTRRISQRAVENISALGGPGAALAVQRGFLRFFESFGYREIGVSCVLRGGVCTMAGIGGVVNDDGSFPIIRGGGIPALNVVGYNHRVDWAVLLSRLQRVLESNEAPRIQ